MIRLDPKTAVAEHITSGGQSEAGRDRVLSDAALEIIEKPVEPGMSGAVVSGLAQLFEALLLVALGAGIFYSYLGPGQEVPYGVAIVISIAFYNVIANAWGLHKIPAYRSLLTQPGRVLASWSIVFLLLTAFMFLFKLQDSYSRVWLVSYYALGAVSLILFRFSLRALVMHWSQHGRLRRRTVIVGGGKDAEELINRIEASAQSDIQLFGLFDDRDDERSPKTVAGYRKLGRVSDLIEFARRTRVDLVIVSMPLSAETRVLQMLKQLWVLPVDIRLSAHMSKLQFKSRAYSYLGDVAVFDMADKPISDWNVILKWCFDKLVAITALTLLSPVMIATAIAIKLDSKGPVLFRQKRHGFNNELIDVFKFRSMYTDMSDVTADRLVTRNDPRVTRVGRFIRKTSIDELPQLFNVLKGELSVIGPRPHALQAKAANMLYHEAVDGYFARHKVKPGITGWAQIHGWRGETDTIDKIMQRVNHDLYYIENWSIFLDAYILLMTPFSLVSKNENAF